MPPPTRSAGTGRFSRECPSFFGTVLGQATTLLVTKVGNKPVLPEQCKLTGSAGPATTSRPTLATVLFRIRDRGGLEPARRTCTGVACELGRLRPPVAGVVPDA